VEGTQDGGVVSSTKVRRCSSSLSVVHELTAVSTSLETSKRDPVTNRTIEASLSNIDDKTMHEMYMWPFADAVHAGTASISKPQPLPQPISSTTNWIYSVLLPTRKKQLATPAKTAIHERPPQSRARLQRLDPKL